MVVIGCKEEVYLSFAISMLMVFYLFLIVLESPWSNGGLSWLPQDSCFPVSTKRLSSVIDCNVSSIKGEECYSSGGLLH
ncbi:unnamed protein product [Ilex paraguariensis]|uniref:Uncharacterized protein n=1 Tax=Ilex paraguariensis TaxID=185542 RepID=A0ABC8RF65_9AQUA